MYRALEDYVLRLMTQKLLSIDSRTRQQKALVAPTTHTVYGSTCNAVSVFMTMTVGSVGASYHGVRCNDGPKSQFTTCSSAPNHKSFSRRAGQGGPGPVLRRNGSTEFSRATLEPPVKWTTSNNTPKTRREWHRRAHLALPLATVINKHGSDTFISSPLFVWFTIFDLHPDMPVVSPYTLRSKRISAPSGMPCNTSDGGSACSSAPCTLGSSCLKALLAVCQCPFGLRRSQDWKHHVEACDSRSTAATFKPVSHVSCSSFSPELSAVSVFMHRVGFGVAAHSFCHFEARCNAGDSL